MRLLPRVRRDGAQARRHPRKTCDHTRRRDGPSAGQHRVSRRGRGRAAKGRRGHRPVPHGVPLPEPAHRAGRAGAVRGLCRGDAGLQGQARGHPHLRPRRRQIHPEPAYCAGAQPLPGAAVHPVLPAEPSDVQDAAPGHPAGLRPRTGQDHVPADHEPAGAAAGQDDPARRDGGPGRGGHRVQSATWRWASWSRRPRRP